MRILISNDDGIDSPGIRLLAERLEEVGEVIVVAPHRERSTAGHSLTLHKPLRIIEVAKNRYATSGTPADCIYLGTREILKGKPDLIVSGINAGANLGTDVHYSGTVAAAREAALMNIRAYAFSLVDLPGAMPKPSLGGSVRWRFEVGAEVARRVILATRELSFPSHSLLNVNIPNTSLDAIRGWSVTRQGFRYYANEVTRRTDPRGKDYFWIGGPYLGYEKGESSDCHALEQGKVAITPLTIDCTHEEFYTQMAGSFTQPF